MQPLETKAQKDAYSSPWTLRQRLGVGLWAIVWLVLARSTPKALNGWRILLLRVFGCRISGRPFVAPSARIKMPWNLTMADRACIGAGTEVYSLDRVVLEERCTVAQQVYLCTGTHDFSMAHLPLQTAPITVCRDAFVGARATILPGVTIGEATVVGAASVVSRDLPDGMICAGNPCKPIKPRKRTP